MLASLAMILLPIVILLALLSGLCLFGAASGGLPRSGKGVAFALRGYLLALLP
jgi:hypothetical protein